MARHTAVPLRPPAGAPGLSAEPHGHGHCISPVRDRDEGWSHVGTCCWWPHGTDDYLGSRQTPVPVHGLYRETPAWGPAWLCGHVPGEHQLPTPVPSEGGTRGAGGPLHLPQAPLGLGHFCLFRGGQAGWGCPLPREWHRVPEGW